MKMLPVYHKPYPDEDMHGWIARQAVLNGVTRKEVERDFLGDGKRRAAVTEIAVYMREDTETALKRHTLYYALFPFMKKGTQARYMDAALNGGRRIKLSPGFRFCPECFKADRIEGRRSYFRAWHQYEHITYCADHQCVLFQIEDTTGYLTAASLERSRPVEYHKDGIPELLKGYYLNPVYTDLESWIKSISSKKSSAMGRKRFLLEGLRIRPESVPDTAYLSEVPCPVCGEIYTGHPFSWKVGIPCPKCRAVLSEDRMISQLLKKKETMNGSMERSSMPHAGRE